MPMTLAEKQEYYSLPDVVQRYEYLRFGGAGGQYVDQRECEICVRLLGDAKLILDVPSGTGRLTKRLLDRPSNAAKVIAGDYSLPMLLFSKSAGRINHATRLNAFQLPFPDNSLDAVVTLRFLFHIESLEPFFKEVYRVLKPGGSLVGNTATWSPKSIPGVSRFCGGDVYLHAPRQVVEVAQKIGYQIEVEEGAFLFTPLIYRYLPRLVINALFWLESIVPQRARVNMYWKLTK
ncbi:methyltransferase domain-containing protein [bacterium]|nr:methyltransferase domain-containing protein [bacterium]